jgi:predicted dehydrogenase
VKDDIDLLHYVLGPTVRVHAEKSVSRRKHAGQDENDQAEEGAALILKFASGALGTFLLSDSVASPLIPNRPRVMIQAYRRL